MKLLKSPFPYLLYCSFILYLCVKPSPELPAGVDDKTAHILSFLGVGFLGFFYWNKFWHGAITGVLFGYAIEIIQSLLPASFHRGYDFWDAMADALGVFLGILIAILLERLWENFLKKYKS